MATDKESVDTIKNTLGELLTFRRVNVAEPTFKTIVYPTGKTVNLQKLTIPKKEPSQATLSDYTHALGWIITGNAENWKIALKENV